MGETKTNAALVSCLSKGGIQDLLEDTYLYDDLQSSLEKLTQRLAKEGKRPSPRIKDFKLWDAALERLIREPDATPENEAPAKTIVEAAVDASGRDNATAIVVSLS